MNRVHIDAPAGVIDIEGEKDFVEGLLSKLFPLLEEAGFGSKPQSQENWQNGESEVAAIADSPADESGKSATAPKLKRKRVVPPKGHSCADRIQGLKDEGFFKTKKSTSEIVSGLAANGFTHKSNQVAAATESLFKRNLLQRTKDGSGPFMYFWDRS